MIIPNLVNNYENCLEISESDIASVIDGIKNNMSVGLDGIALLFIKSCKSSLLKPLYLLFNQSLTTGSLPSIWKKSFVTPIFKSGIKSDIKNYRPISLLCTLAKLLDAIMVNKLTEKFIHLIASNQHGFMKGRSIISNLLFYILYFTYHMRC